MVDVTSGGLIDFDHPQCVCREGKGKILIDFDHPNIDFDHRQGVCRECAEEPHLQRWSELGIKLIRLQGVREKKTFSINYMNFCSSFLEA